MASREEFDQHARYLRDTNYVYRDNNVHYRTDLKDALLAGRAVPSCFEACARFVRVDPDDEDVAQAQGPASSTAAGAQERAAAADADAAEFVKNLSIVGEDTADASEVSTLPRLQRLLENMDAQAGRVVANETYCQVEEGGFAALDDVGRERLLNVCRKFHAQCQRQAPDEEARQLLWRVQQIVNGRSHQEDEAEPEGGGHKRLSFGPTDKADAE